MIEYKEVEVTQQVPTKMICDRCGLELIDNYGGGVGVGDSDMVEVKHHFGYGSLNDGEYWEFDICEKCLEETIKKMNIKVRKYKGCCDEDR